MNRAASRNDASTRNGLMALTSPLGASDPARQQGSASIGLGDHSRKLWRHIYRLLDITAREKTTNGCHQPHAACAPTQASELNIEFCRSAAAYLVGSER